MVPPILANVAASLSAQLQHLAAPFSILPSIVGDGIEDHNSQAYSAALALRDALELAEHLLAIEALAATGVSALDPAIHLRRRGGALAPFAEEAARILEAYEPSGATQAQLGAFRDALRRNSKARGKTRNVANRPSGAAPATAATTARPAAADPCTNRAATGVHTVSSGALA